MEGRKSRQVRLLRPWKTANEIFPTFCASGQTVGSGSLLVATTQFDKRLANRTEVHTHKWMNKYIAMV